MDKNGYLEKEKKIKLADTATLSMYLNKFFVIKLSNIKYLNKRLKLYLIINN